MNFHYGPDFNPPRIRNWIPTVDMIRHCKAWKRKQPLPPPKPRDKKPMNWHWLAYWCRDYTLKRGYGPGSDLCFVDNIPGPGVIELKPGQQQRRYDELANYKLAKPDIDWEPEFADRDAKLRPPSTPPTAES